jgi:hypothetical protein
MPLESILATAELHAVEAPPDFEAENRAFTRRDAHAIEALAALGGPVYSLLTELTALAMGGKRAGSSQ